MPRFIFLFPIVLLFLIGCCGAPRIPPTSNYHTAQGRPTKSLYIDVLIDQDFSEQERFEIEEALGQVNYAMNDYVIYRVKEDRHNFEQDIEADTWQLRFMQKTNYDSSGIIAYVNDIPGDTVVVYTNRLEAVSKPESVITHEILHSLGAIHNRHVGSIMYRQYQGQGDCIDQYALVGVIDAKPWIDPHNLNFCEIK